MVEANKVEELCSDAASKEDALLSETKSLASTSLAGDDDDDDDEANDKVVGSTNCVSSFEDALTLVDCEA